MTVAACRSCSFFFLFRRQTKYTIPTIAARTSTEPATAPAIAPPLMSVKSDDDEDGEAAAPAGEGAASDVELADVLEDVG